MMGRATFSGQLGLLTVFLFLFAFVGCSEKSTPPVAEPQQSDGNNDGDGDSDGSDDSDGDGDSGDGGDDGEPSDSEYDLCEALEDENDLEEWSALVDFLCDKENRLKGLRVSDRVYKGDDKNPTVKIGSEDEDGSEVSFRLYSSSLSPVKVSKYWDMLKLQFFEPDEFDDNFARDKYLDKYEILSDSSTKVEYRYINVKEEASPVDYEAESKFIKLESNQAYVVATKLTESNETMLDMSGIIIINKKSSKTTEVFIVSDQTYDKGKQETSVARKNALESFEEEQIRAFENSKVADEYFD